MNKKVVVLGILAVCLSISIGIGFSYAVWTQTEKQNDMNVFESGCFKIELTEEKDIIDLSNQYPIHDEDGKKLIPYTFTVENACSIYASYSVNLEKLAGSNLDNEFIKVMLNNKLPHLYNYYSVAPKEDNSSVESRTLITDGLEAEESRTYKLRIWIDESGTNETVGGKTFNSKIVISAIATYQSGAEYIASLLKDNSDTMKNDDPDENVRYIGATPNNYVTFNNEPWRIIGVFDTFECNDDATVENYTSKCSVKKLLKIIRNDFLGGYSWDSSDSSINSGYGVNEWSQADLNKLLNDYYYNSKSNQICYYGENNNYTNCDFNPTGIKEENQDMIANILWNTGTIDKYYSISVGAKEIYEGERSGNTGKNSTSGDRFNDKVLRTTKWIGKVGLMYPSDYGYSIGIGQRTACLANGLYSYSGCASSSWLFNNSVTQWTLTPILSNFGASVALRVHESGNVYDGGVFARYGVRPVVYLKSDIKIIHDKDHDGSEGKPYELSI